MAAFSHMALLALLVASLGVPTAAAAVAARTSVTPVQKVVEMLDGMLKKAKEGKHEEAVQFQAYQQFCSDSELEKQKRVKAADLLIEDLTAKIAQYNAEVVRLQAEIWQHSNDTVKFAEEIENATAIRKTEREDYEVEHIDFTESLYALDKAIATLQKQPRKISQAAALLQKLGSLESAPKAARRILDSFLQSADEPALGLLSEPDPYAYEAHSDGIIEMLKGLKSKFTDQINALEKAEMKQRYAFETLKLDLSNNIAFAEAAIKKKEKYKAENEELSADASARLKEVSAERAEDMQYLTDLHTTCNQKASDFEEREKLRGEEIQAIEKAVEILASVAGKADKHLPSMAQRKKGTVLLQHIASDKRPSQESAAKYLAYQSERIGSHVLSALSVRMQSDPFVKVRKLIEDLIRKLRAQAQEEATHKQWCDTEVADNKGTRDTKTREVEQLKNTIDQLNVDIAKYEKDIADLSMAVATLTADMATAQKLRMDEKNENEDTIADAVAAQSEVGQAMTVLKDFYDNAADATALLQSRKPFKESGPEIFDSPFKGTGGAQSNNVLAFLEVIQSDFARLESETTEAENTAKAAHDTYMTETEADKSLKEADIDTFTNQKKQAEQDVVTNSNNLELAQSELDSALEYWGKLRPACLGTVSDTDTTTGYKERIQRRKEEIASLKEALAILDGTADIEYAPDAHYSSVDGGNRGMDVGITAN